QLIDAVLGHLQHRVLVSEVKRSGGAGLDAVRLEPDAVAVDAERALGHFASARVVAGHVERTPRLAQTAADAGVGVHIDDAVLVLDDGAGRRAGAQAARIGAVHALVLAHQPGQRIADLDLVELDQVPILRVQRGHRLVRAALLGLHRRQVVPFGAGHLAGLAADADGRVDVLGDDGQLARASRRPPERGGRLADLHPLLGGRHGYAFSTLTRKTLNSGVQVLGSIALGVSRLASGPVWAGSPAY